MSYLIAKKKKKKTKTQAKEQNKTPKNKLS